MTDELEMSIKSAREINPNCGWVLKLRYEAALDLALKEIEEINNAKELYQNHLKNCPNVIIPEKDKRIAQLEDIIKRAKEVVKPVVGSVYNSQRGVFEILSEAEGDKQ